MDEHRWVGITGSWRKGSPELMSDVAREVTTVLRRGDGIVTGGALGVDYLATVLALDHAPDGSQLRVIIPTPLAVYASHYHKRAAEGVISIEQAGALIQLLGRVAQIGSLTHLNHDVVNERTYYLRNGEVVKASSELLAFQVNGSAGVDDTIQQAAELGIVSTVFSYNV